MEELSLPGLDHYALPPDRRYFTGAVLEANRILGDRGLKFYLTWSLDRLPETGPKVVVLLAGDERVQIPSFAADVKAVFKTGGVRAFYPTPLCGPPTLTRLSELARAGRDALVRCKRRKLTARARAARMFPIPLGYSRQLNLPIKPFAARENDLFFAGWVGGKFSPFKPSHWKLRPAALSRGKMVGQIERLKQLAPQARYDLVMPGVDQEVGRLDETQYSYRLMNARICLAPRGNFPETFRFFEAARYGCVIICEPIADEWYNRDHPGLVFPGWRGAAERIAALLDSPDELMDLHHKSLAWWRTRGSEQALGQYLAQTILALPDASTDAPHRELA